MSQSKRMHPVERGTFALESAGLVVSALLIAWLLSFLFRPPTPGAPFAALRVASARPAESALPIVAFQDEDARAIDANPSTVETPADLIKRLPARLSEQVGPARVAWVSAFAVMKDGQAWLVPDGGPTADPEPGRPVAELLKAAVAGSEGRPTLLLLDLVPVTNDLSWGLYANPVMDAVASSADEILKETSVVAITATAAGQRSWIRTDRTRTAFSWAVTRALEGDAKGWDPDGEDIGVTIQGLYRHVSAHVARWVEDHHARAAQTPLLLPSKDARNFRLPKLAVAMASPASVVPEKSGPEPPKEAPKAEEKGKAEEKPAPPAPKGGEPSRVATLASAHAQAWSAWSERMKDRPERQQPRAWRSATEQLQRVERLALVAPRSRAEADRLLAALSAAPLADLPASRTIPALSLATGPDEARAAQIVNQREILAYLTGDSSLKPPPPAEEKPKPAEPKATSDPAKPPSATPGDAAAGFAGESADLTKTEPRAAVDLRTAADQDPEAFGPIEAQTSSWALTFVSANRRGRPEHFRGARGLLLRRAVEIRLGPLVPPAKTPSEGLRGLEWAVGHAEAWPWIGADVRRADAARRRAVDLLFPDEPARADEAARARVGGRLEGDDLTLADESAHHLLVARSATLSANRAAEAVGRALAALNQIQSELPDLAAWKAADAGAASAPASLLAALNAAKRLAAAVAEDPAAPEKSGDRPGRPGEDLRLLALPPTPAPPPPGPDFRALADAAEQALSVLRTEAIRRAEAAAKSGANPEFDEVERLLRIPGLPPETRNRLFTHAGSLRAEEEVKLVPTVAPPEVRPDPAILREAAALADIELSLWAVAGLGDDRLAKLREAIDRAKAPAAKVGDWASVTARSWELRRNAAASPAEPGAGAIKPTPAEAVARLAVRDRLARRGPLGPPIGPGTEAPDAPTRDLIRARSAAIGIVQAGRLTADLAPKAALAALADIPPDDPTFSDPIKKEIEAATAARDANFSVALDVERDPLTAWDDRPVKVLVRAPSGFPRGESTLWMAPPGELAALVEAKSRQDEARPIPVPIPEDVPAPIYALARRDPEAGSVRVAARLFYRGRYADAPGSVVDLDVRKVNKPVELFIEEDLNALARRFATGRDELIRLGYGDQFQREGKVWPGHPREGYLYDSATSYLFYQIRVRNTSASDRRVIVSWTTPSADLALNSGSEQVAKAVTIKPKGVSEVGIAGGEIIRESLKGGAPKAIVAKVIDADSKQLLDTLKVDLKLLNPDDLVGVVSVGFDPVRDREFNEYAAYMKGSTVVPDDHWFQVFVEVRRQTFVRSPISVKTTCKVAALTRDRSYHGCDVNRALNFVGVRYAGPGGLPQLVGDPREKYVSTKYMYKFYFSVVEGTAPYEWDVSALGRPPAGHLKGSVAAPPPVVKPVPATTPPATAPAGQ